jgi:hypothetical protein
MPYVIARIFAAVLLISCNYLQLVNAAEAHEFRFPIHISENGRYFEDSKGKPVLVHGDSAWSLITQLNLKETEYYLDRRRAQGFNSIMVNLIEKKYSAHPPRNASGDLPFLRPGDLSTPNEVYFAHADAVIMMAARKGFLVFLVPAYLGWRGGDDGWFQEIQRAGVEKLGQYGRFLGSRYKTYSNIVWVVGGDFTPPQHDQWTVDVLAEGIRKGGSTQLMTAHCGGESPARAFGNKKWLDFNNVYSYSQNLHVHTVKEYNRRPVKPFILIESIYENEHASTPNHIRRQAYWSILTGAAGHFYGNNPVWNFGSPYKVFPTEEPWKKALDSKSAKDMSQLCAIFRGIRWEKLVPDTAHLFVVAGYGEEMSEQYSTAAVIQQSRDIIVYVADGSPNKLSIKLGENQKGCELAWIDPTSGIAIINDMPAHSREGIKEIVIPGENSSGGMDWLLHIRMK